MGNTNKKVIRTEVEQKQYNKDMAEKRKTNEFFVESSNKRTNTVIKAMNRLSIMSRYNGNEEQKEKILIAVKTSVENLENLFNNTKDKNEFKL